MATELLDVIDTAVKIGLGALITGATTYAVSNRNHKNEKQKYLLEHKIQTIETCAEKVDEYFDAWMGLLIRVGAIVRRKEEAGTPLDDISAPQKKQIRDKDAFLAESWTSKNYAISRFRILGATEVVESIMKSNKPQKSLREQVIFNDDLPTYEIFVELRKELNDIKKNVHKSISKFYDEVSA